MKNPHPSNLADKNAQWEHIKSLIAEFSNENTWHSPTYEGAITQGMPLTALAGNGNVGATSNGDANTKSYILAITEFWSDNSKAYIGSGAWQPMIITGGVLTVDAWDRSTKTVLPAAKSNFLEEQDIVRAEIRTSMYMGNAKVKIVDWISADKNIMVTEVTSESDETQTMRAHIEGNKNNSAFLPREAGTGITDNGQKYVWATRQSNKQPYEGVDSRWLNEIGMAMTVFGCDGAEYSSNDVGTIVFDLPAHGTVYIVTSVKCAAWQKIDAVTGVNGPAVKHAVDLLSSIASVKDIEDLHISHLDWWKEFYLLSWVDLGDKDLNRLYYGNQYLFGCSTRKGVQAPGIFSVWVTTDNPLWQGDFHLNYNMQAPYYGSFSSNRMSEFSDCMFELFLGYIDYGLEYSSNLKTLKKCSTPWYWSTREHEPAFREGFKDSLLFPINMAPQYNMENLIERHLLNQTMNAMFCGHMFITYYLYSQDYEWLTTKRQVPSGKWYSPYDFLAKTANFYTYWVEKRAPRIDDEYIKDAGAMGVDPTDYTANYYKYPEYNEAEHGDNYVYVIFDGAHEASYEFNPGVITGGVHYLTDTLKALGVETAKKCGYTEEHYAAWKDISEHLVTPEVCIYKEPRYNNLPVFGLSEDRGVREGAATVNLEWVQPAYQLGFNGKPHMLEAARNTVTVMGDIVSTWAQIGNPPKIFVHGSRVGYDADTLISRMKTFCIAPMAPNNHIVDYNHGWEKAGVIEALNTMMVMSDGGIIKTFPTWNGTDAKFNTIRMPGAFLVSSELKDGKVQFVEIKSEKGGELKLVIPFEGELELIDLTTGEAVDYTTAVTENSKDNYLIANTEAGHTYRLQLKK